MYNGGTMPSLADIAAVTGNNDGFNGGNAWWILIILFALWGNNGWGGYGGGGAADNYVLASDFATLQRQIDTTADGLRQQSTGIANGLCDGFYTQAQLVNGVNTNLLTQGNATNTAMMQGFNALQGQIAQCCCDNRYESLMNANATQNAIANGFCQTNYNAQTNTRDLVENQNANTRAILDALADQKTEALKERIAEQQAQISALNLAASQQAQNNYIVNQLRPMPIPAYQVANPFGCNCGYQFPYGTVIGAVG